MTVKKNGKKTYENIKIWKKVIFKHNKMSKGRT